LQIQFVVFEPKTAKVRGQGNVYLRQRTNRIGIGIGRSLPRCYPPALNSLEFAIIEAGIETAERIMRALALTEPPLCAA
jgi:hypothetical protein